MNVCIVIQIALCANDICSSTQAIPAPHCCSALVWMNFLKSLKSAHATRTSPNKYIFFFWIEMKIKTKLIRKRTHAHWVSVQCKCVLTHDNHILNFNVTKLDLSPKETTTLSVKMDYMLSSPSSWVTNNRLVLGPQSFCQPLSCNMGLSSCIILQKTILYIPRWHSATCPTAL